MSNLLVKSRICLLELGDPGREVVDSDPEIVDLEVGTVQLRCQICDATIEGSYLVGEGRIGLSKLMLLGLKSVHRGGKIVDVNSSSV